MPTPGERLAAAGGEVSVVPTAGGGGGSGGLDQDELGRAADVLCGRPPGMLWRRLAVRWQ